MKERPKTIAQGLEYNGFEFSHVDFNEWVYMLLDRDNKIYYVGKSYNVKERIKEHRRQGNYVETFFYRDFSSEISDFVEFYFINVFKPKANTYDVMREKIRVDRLIRYLNRFTDRNAYEQDFEKVFELANIPQERYRFYDEHDLLLLMIAYHDLAGNDYITKEIMPLKIWGNVIKEEHHE